MIQIICSREKDDISVFNTVLRFLYVFCVFAKKHIIAQLKG